MNNLTGRFNPYKTVKQSPEEEDEQQALLNSDNMEGDFDTTDELSKKKRIIKVWSEQEDKLLIKYADKFRKKWELVAQNIPGRNASQCAQRYRRIFPGRVRSHWTQEEDDIVLSGIKKYGKNWGLIASNLEGRTGKQVRERYINCLDPSICW